VKECIATAITLAVKGPCPDDELLPAGEMNNGSVHHFPYGNTDLLAARDPKCHVESDGYVTQPSNATGERTIIPMLMVDGYLYLNSFTVD
jgi:hypothetical protein